MHCVKKNMLIHIFFSSILLVSYGGPVRVIMIAFNGITSISFWQHAYSIYCLPYTPYVPYTTCHVYHSWRFCFTFQVISKETQMEEVIFMACSLSRLGWYDDTQKIQIWRMTQIILKAGDSDHWGLHHNLHQRPDYCWSTICQQMLLKFDVESICQHWLKCWLLLKYHLSTNDVEIWQQKCLFKFDSMLKAFVNIGWNVDYCWNTFWRHSNEQNYVKKKGAHKKRKKLRC